MNDNGTTVWVDRETRQDLQEAADGNGRSVIDQIRWMVKKALKELEQSGEKQPDPQ